MKEHLVRHDSKHKIQVHTIKRNKQQHKHKQNRTHFQNKNNEKPEKRRSLTKTKARGKNENRWVQQTHTLTHSHTLTRACTSTQPPTHPPKIWGKGGGDSTGIHSIKLEITTLIENKKMERKKRDLKKKKASCYRSTYS